MTKQFVINVEDVVIPMDAESESLVQPMVVQLDDYDMPFSDLIDRHKKQFGDDGVTIYGVIGFNIRFKSPPNPTASKAE